MSQAPHRSSSSESPDFDRQITDIISGVGSRSPRLDQQNTNLCWAFVGAKVFFRFIYRGFKKNYFQIPYDFGPYEKIDLSVIGEGFKLLIDGRDVFDPDYYTTSFQKSILFYLIIFFIGLNCGFNKDGYDMPSIIMNNFDGIHLFISQIVFCRAHGNFGLQDSEIQDFFELFMFPIDKFREITQFFVDTGITDFPHESILPSQSQPRTERILSYYTAFNNNELGIAANLQQLLGIFEYARKRKLYLTFMIFITDSPGVMHMTGINLPNGNGHVMYIIPIANGGCIIKNSWGNVNTDIELDSDGLVELNQYCQIGIGLLYYNNNNIRPTRSARTSEINRRNLSLNAKREKLNKSKRRTSEINRRNLSLNKRKENLNKSRRITSEINRRNLSLNARKEKLNKSRRRTSEINRRNLSLNTKREKLNKSRRRTSEINRRNLSLNKRKENLNK